MKQGLRSCVTGLLAVLLLVACNGGGGGGGEEPPPLPPPQGPDLQTSVPAPTYAAGSKESGRFNAINTFRQENGMGLLAQNTKLDVVALNHSLYISNTPSPSSPEVDGSIETPSGYHFTGALEQDRCDFVGYAGDCPRRSAWTDMQITYYYSTDPAVVSHGSGDAIAYGYSALPVLTQGAREIGMAWFPPGLQWPEQPASHYTYISGASIQLAYPGGTTPQRQGDGFILAAALFNSIHVHVKEGETLEVDAFQVWKANGEPLAGQWLTSVTDPHHLLPGHAAMFLPADWVSCSALPFTLHFVGKRNGVPFTVDRTLDKAWFWLPGC